MIVLSRLYYRTASSCGVASDVDPDEDGDDDDYNGDNEDDVGCDDDDGTLALELLSQAIDCMTTRTRKSEPPSCLCCILH